MTFMIINQRQALRQFPVQGRDNLAHSLGRTCGRGDNVVVNTTPTTPVLVRRPIDSLLCSGGGVDGSHQPLDDTKVVMDDLGKGSKAVGGA